MAVSVDQFGKSLVASGLMTAEEVQGVWNTLPAGTRPKDGDGFAKLLTRLGTITDFQAEQVLAGKGTSLVLGDYVMLSKIGAGGMGQVFKARHRRMKRIVAIKLLPAAVVKDAAAVKRFEREVEAAARLTHPNIVAALDARAEKGVHYLVMECVEGRDLSAIAKERGPLPVEEAVEYIRQAACGLAYAHSEGVVHRDIKPANLLLDKKGTVKILDMGLARFDESGDAADHQLTNTGQVMGTVDYMAPEQAQDTHAADARSDIYSLGCSLYRLLVGESVFHAETVVKKILAHMNAPIPSLVAKRPDVPAEVDRVFQRMMAKQPEDRYQTMDEVVAALSPFAAGAVSSTSVTSPGGATDTNLTNFLQSLGGAAATSRSQVLPSKTSVAPEQTLARVNPEVGTDPKSELSLGVKGSGVRGQGSVIQAAASPVNRDAKRSASSRGKKPPLLWIAAGGGGILAALLGVIVIVYGPDGEEVARVKVPEGGSVEMKTGEPRPLGSGTVAPGTTPPLPNGRGSSRSPGSSGMSPLAALLLSSDYVWSEPENLGPNVNGPNNDHIISLTSDERRLFFHGNDATGRHRYAEAVRNSPADAFGKPQPITTISTDAYIGGDGLTAVAIIRGESSTHDIMLQRRPKLGDPWDKGDNLGPQVNSPANERLPTLSPDGLTLLFSTTRRANTANDLWVSRRKSLADPFGPATSVGPPVNSEFTPVRSGVLLGDGQTILFNRGDKLHIAFTGPNGGRAALELENHPFVPESSGPLNVWLAPDGRTAYFTADRPGGHGGKDIWVTPRVPKSGSAAPQQQAQPATSLPLAEFLVSPDYVWTEPENLGAPVNSTSGETCPAVSGDGLVLVFAAARAGGMGSSDLYITQRKRIEEPFAQPVNMGPTINSPSPDLNPWLSTDGRTLLFSTNRDGDAGNLYYATRTSQDAPFSPALPFKGAVNTSSSEFGGARTGDGRVLVFTSSNGGNEDLWQATRDDPQGAFEKRIRLGDAVNSPLVERHPWLSADGRLLLFSTYPENTNDKSLKATDTETRIWMASRPDLAAPFGPRTLLNVPVPFDGHEQHPSLTADGRLLFYSSQRTADASDHDIWLTRRVPKGATSPSPPATSNSPNTALQFDGDDLVEIPALTFDPQGSYTLEAFITSPAIADKGAGLAFGMPEQSYLSFTRLGDWRWVYSPRSRDHGTDIAISGAPARQERTHVACVRNGQSHRLYVDGKLFSKTAEIPSPAVGTSPFQIGDEFRGVIDELRVSKVARYTADFTPAARFEPDVDTLGLYHFDEAAGDVLKDSSGHSHHGQITGATWVKVDGSAIDLKSKVSALAPVAQPPNLRSVPRTPLPDGPPGEALQIPLTNRAAFVVAGRDGRHAAVYDAVAYKVLWYDLASGKLVWERKFTDTPGGVGLAISHDGQTLTLCGYRTATKTGVVHLLRTADGGVAQPLTAAEYFRSIAFSPDDKLLAVGTDAGSVMLFDLAGGAPPRLLTGLTTRIDAVAFSPSGDKLAAGAGYKVGIAATTAVWNAVTGVRDVWSASDNIGIASLEYSRDGKAILAGTGNASASLYDAATGNQLGVVKDPRRQSLRNARLLPSGRHALCAGGRLLLCELPSCQIIQEFGEPTAEVIIDLDVVPDGRFAVSLLANEPILRVWRLPEAAWAPRMAGALPTVAPIAAAPRDAAANDYALDPAANPDRANATSVELPRFLKASDPMTIEMFVTPRSHADAKQSRSLWSLAGRLELKQWADRWVWQHNHNDGTQRLEVISTPTGPLGQRVHLAAVSTGKEMRLFVNGQRAGTHVYAGTLPSVAGVPMNLANSPAEAPGPGYVPFDGTIDDVRISMVARYDADFTPAASHEVDADTAALYRCNEGTGDVLIDSSSHRRNGKVIGVRWSLDGGAPPSNPQSEIRNPKSSIQPRTFPGHERVVREVAITPDGKCAVSVGWDNTWRRWDLETGTQLNKVPAHPSLTNCLAISPDGKLLVTGASDNHVKLWDLATGIEKRSYYVPKAGHFSTLAFTPDGQQFLSASSDGKTRLWGLEDSNVVREFSGTGPDVWDIAFLPGSEQFVTVGSDKQARFWNLKTGRQVANLPEHPTGVAAAVFSPKGRWLTTASNGLIQFWIPTTRTLEWDWKFNNTSAGTLAFLPGGRYLVVGLQDKSIRIYDTTDRKEVHKFQAPSAVTQHLAITPDGRQIVSGGGYQVIDKLRPDDDFQLYIWDVPPQFVNGK